MANPLRRWGSPDIDHWDEKEKLKILLTESLISSSLLFYDNPLKTEEDLSRRFSRRLRTLEIFTTIFFLNSPRLPKLFSDERNLRLNLLKKFWTNELNTPAILKEISGSIFFTTVYYSLMSSSLGNGYIPMPIALLQISFAMNVMSYDSQ